MEISGEVRAAKKRRLRHPAGLYQAIDSSGIYLLALFFLLGSVFGALVGAFSDAEGIPRMIQRYVHPEASGISFIGVLWNTSWYHLLAIFLGSSVFGFALLPALSALRGYLMTVTVASIITSIPGSGILLTLVYLGFPAMLSIPCFFVLSTDAFAASRRLYVTVSGNHKQVGGAPLLRHFTVCAAALVVASALEAYVSPMLARLI